MWGVHEGMGWWMLLGWLSFVLFWGVVAYLIFLAISRTGGARRGDDDTPMEILRRRYARGELTREQYEEMRRDLS